MKKKLKIIKMRLRRMGLILLIIAIASTVGAILMQKFDLFGVGGQELGAYDGGLNFWTKRASRSKDITLVLLDEKSFSVIDHHYKEKFGTWPYQRSIWAYLLNYFMDCGVRAVAFDFLMTEETTDDTIMIEALKEMQLRHIPFYSTFDFDVERDALPPIRPVNRVLHPEISHQIDVQVNSGSLTESQPHSIDDLVFDNDSVDSAAKESTHAKKPDLSLPAAQTLTFPVYANGFSLPTFPDDVLLDEQGEPSQKTRPVHPNPPISSIWPYTQFGLAAAELDLTGNDDGKMRRTAFGYCDETNCYATLAVAMAAGLLKAESVQISKGKLQIGDRYLAIDDDGTAGIHYGGNYQERYKNISFIYVLEDAIWRDPRRGTPGLREPKYIKDLKDKVVFVALAKGDNKGTPFEKDSPGVIKHAATLDNLLTGQFIIDAPYTVSVCLALLLALLSVLVILIVESAFLEIGWPILVFFGFYVIPGYFLYKYQLHILSVMPALAGSFASVLASAYKNFFAEKEREELKGLFSSYMDKELVEQMVEWKELPSLAGEIREISILFSDIQDFSKQIDKHGLDLQTRMRILNIYLERMTKILVKEGACLDKYVGHEIHTFFGTPIPHSDHALRACRAALLMRQADQELRLEFESKNWPCFNTRIGINTDQVLVGNIGSEQLVDYTALGDGMDKTVGLREATTKYHAIILISQKTWEQAKDDIEVREVGREKLLGQSEETIIYELLSLKEHPLEESKEGKKRKKRKRHE